MLAQFQSITGLDDAERASFFLEASNWNVDLAISSFFDDPAGAIAPEDSMEAREPSTSEENMDTSGEREKPSGRGKFDFGSPLNNMNRQNIKITTVRKENASR